MFLAVICISLALPYWCHCWFNMHTCNGSYLYTCIVIHPLSNIHPIIWFIWTVLSNSLLLCPAICFYRPTVNSMIKDPGFLGYDALVSGKEVDILADGVATIFREVHWKWRQTAPLQSWKLFTSQHGIITWTLESLSTLLYEPQTSHLTLYW